MAYNKIMHSIENDPLSTKSPKNKYLNLKKKIRYKIKFILIFFNQLLINYF